jgi:transcriptional regulator with XRE-family HTH domain
VIPSVVPELPRPTWKTFGEALAACLKKEGLTQTQFSKIAGIASSSISAYVTGYRFWSQDNKKHPVGMSHLVYDRLLSLLPDLKYAPRPRVSANSYSQIPGPQPGKGRPAAEAKPAAPPPPTVPKGAIARPPEDDVAVRAARPMPPMPESLRKPGLPPPGVAAVKPLPMVVEALDKAKAITEAAAAWGAALAKCERLRGELAAAEAEVSASYERVQRLVKGG